MTNARISRATANKAATVTPAIKAAQKENQKVSLVLKLKLYRRKTKGLEIGAGSIVPSLRNSNISTTIIIQ